MSTLSWENLEIGYKNTPSLIYPSSGEINRAGIYAVLGSNGCGKSTLLKTWLGLVPPRSGQVKLETASMQADNNSISHGIGYVPQFHTVNKYFHICVFDFIKQGFGPTHTLTPADKLNITQFLKDWQLAGYENKSFHELSGGQKVRCMLVRAIVSHPKILFLDEPLANLDSCCQQQLMDTLEYLVIKKQVCVLMVDHHFENFTKYISAKIVFHKSHDEERSSVRVDVCHPAESPLASPRDPR